MRPTRFVTRLSAAALVCAASALSGCDQQDPISAEIKRADLVLNSLTTGGYTPMPTGDRKREDLQWIINRLTGKAVAGLPKSLSGDGVKGAEAQRGKISKDLPTLSVAPVDSSDPSQAGAANLLVARAQAGLAELHAQEQQEKEGALLNQIAIIRASMNEWAMQNMLARGQESYNPAQDIARFEQQITDRQNDLATRQAAKAKQDAAIAELNARAQEANASAEAERVREAGLRNQMTTGTQTQRAALLEQLTQVKRAGDALEKQAANLLAEVAKEQPKADTLQRDVELAAQQIELLRNAVTETKARAEQAKVVAASARASAAEAAARLDKLIAEAKGLRTNADGPANEALRLYGQALSAAKKAQTQVADQQTKGPAAATAGAYSQSTGDVQAARARGLSQLAIILNNAATSTEALPNASAYRADADAMAQQAAEARAAAMNAYKGASELFAKAGFKNRADEIKAKLDALSDSYNDTIKVEAPAKDAPAEGEKPAAEGEAAAAPVAADFDKAAAETEARTFLQTFVDDLKAGKVEAAMGAVGFEDADEGKTLASIMPMGMAMTALNAAATDKFGKGLQELVAESKVDAVKASPVMGMLTGMGGAVGGGLGELKNLNAADLPLNAVAADKVEVTLPGQPPMTASKADGQWKLIFPKLGILESPMGGQLKMMAPMLEAAAGALRTVTTKTTDGAYADADAMLIDLNVQLMGAMSKMPGGATPPPGGGG